MNRTLKRPMFRIGGSAGTGITSGLDQPQKMANGGRIGYAGGGGGTQFELPFGKPDFFIGKGKNKKGIYKQKDGTTLVVPIGPDNLPSYAQGGRIEYQQGSMPSFQATGLPGFLTSFGLNLLSTPPQGNIFQTAATAARGPFNQLQASQAAAASTAEDRAFKEKLLERQIASDKEIAAMKQKDQFFAAQTPEEQFRERVKIYSESSIPVIKNNATDIANFEVKNRDQNYVQLDFIYDKGTRQFRPDFRSIPEGALTYNPQDGLAYRNEGGQFIKLNPFTLEPIENIDGSES